MRDNNKIFSWIFYLSVAAVLVLFALQKVADSDTWVHLALGKYFVEHKTIPPGDVFTYPNYGQPYQYFEWLFQVFLYLIYFLAGYNGLMIFKIVLWLCCLGLLWQWMKTEGVESRWAAFFTIFPAFLLAVRWQERPEIMDYFFVALYLWVLSVYRHQKNNYFYFLPLVQILWVNFHSTAVLGILIYTIMLAGEGIDYLVDKNKGELRVIKALALIIPLLAAASFINPYGYKAVIIPYLFSTNKAVQSLITEWLPIGRYQFLYGVYLVFLISAAISFIPLFFHSRKNLKFAEVFLFAGAGLLPLLSARYLALMGLIALPLAAKNYYWFFRNSSWFSKLTAGWTPKVPSLRWAWPLTALLLAGAVLFGLSYKTGGFGWGLQRYAVPVRAVTFIQENHFPGRIYNDFMWGGYVNLMAYPDYMAYIDGRHPDLEILKENISINMMAPGWEKKLERRGINLIMMRSLYFSSGWIIPIIAKLTDDPGWVLVWSEDATLVFLRNSPENQYWIKKFARPKEEILDEIITEGQYLLDNKIKKHTYGSMGQAYLLKGNFAAAKAAYQEHIKLNPHAQEAARTLDFLIKQGY